jgi:glycosyltransferase involved in cell wall biosynthesis
MEKRRQAAQGDFRVISDSSQIKYSLSSQPQVRVLQVHCRYKSGTGGEDSVLSEEYRLLLGNGHTVDQYFVDNASFVPSGWGDAFPNGLLTIWNPFASRALLSAVRHFKPDVVHVHNSFAALSPAIFWALKKSGIPVVLTLHNYRTTCATSILLRGDRPCEKCVGKLPWSAFRYRCSYNNSVAAGMCIAMTQMVHNLLTTYQRKVDAFIVMTAFQRDLMIRSGLPPERVHVKPNFVPDLKVVIPNVEERTDEIAYLGAIYPAKGVDLLLSAWTELDHGSYSLAVLGWGSDSARISAEYAGSTDVAWCGRLPRGEALSRLARARWLIMPSRCYEGFPMVLLEALALGTPVIAPDHGCFPSILADGQNALLFAANDKRALANAIQHAVAMPLSRWEAFSRLAHAEYLKKYTPELNYRGLLNVYSIAIARGGRQGSQP